ncbi:hypothetical protein CsSME_00017996 [Camellia sinensis var. sinensis]
MQLWVDEILCTCPVNFEFLNYTIITSQCKGPQYAPNICCPAFKEFACPYADALNDLSNDCATTMFSYINLYGKYPPGLFASVCREGKQGLACPATAPTQSADSISGSQSVHDSISGSQIVRNPSLLLVLTKVLLVVASIDYVVDLLLPCFPDTARIIEAYSVELSTQKRQYSEGTWQNLQLRLLHRFFLYSDLRHQCLRRKA